MSSPPKTLDPPAPSVFGARGLAALRARSYGLLSGDSIRVSITFAITRAPAFLLPMAIASTLGVSSHTDRFFLALALATFALNAISATAESVAVPFLAEAQHQGRSGRLMLERMMIGVTGGVAVALTVAYVGIRIVWPTPATGSPDGVGAAEYLLALAPYVAFGSVTALATGALYASRRFLIATSSYGLRPLVAIAFVLALGPRIGAVALALGLSLGSLIQILALVAPLRRAYAKPRPRVPAAGGKPALPSLYGQATWQLLASLVHGIMPLIDRFMTWRLETGSLSILEYSERLWAVPVNLLASGVLIVCLTDWSQAHADPLKRKQLRNTVLGAARTVFLAMVPIAALIIGLRYQLVGMVLGRGAFPLDSIPVAADTTAVLFAGMPLYLVGLVYVRALVATKRTRWLFFVAVFQVIAKVSGNLLLLPVWGVVGAAAATTGVHALTCVLLMMAFRRTEPSTGEAT